MSSPRPADDPRSPAARPPRRRFRFGLLLLVALLLAGGAFAAWKVGRAVRTERAIEAARAALAPAIEALAPAPEPDPGPYDVDKTMRVLAELDRAAREAGSTRAYVERIVRQDYRGVPPDVLAARARMLDVLVRMAGALGRVEDHDENWASYRSVLEAIELANSTSFRLGFGPVGVSTSADEEARKEAQAELQRRLAEREELVRALEPLRADLHRAVDQAAPVMRRVAEDWQELCLVRDSAYLAAARLDFERCAARAREAIERSPSETEAHLLLVLAHVEGDLEEAPEAGGVAEALARFLAEHPDQAAPALLLRGVWHARAGRLAEARADLDLAATRYPEQAARLSDALDPYALRGYLRNTTQGREISGLYQALMLGAGWFSPELQLARLAFDQGDRAEGRRLTLEHFQRRRKDQQWNLVLYDVDFCESLLGDDFQALFPEVGYLDLVVEATTMSRLLGGLTGRALEARVTNRSGRTLKNGMLILCLRVTDMHPDDYFTRALPTQPSIPAGTTTTFGKVDIDPLWRERGKTVDDLVEPIRAILLTDDTVFRIDSLRYKNDLVQRYLTQDGEGPPASLSARLLQAVESIVARTTDLSFSATSSAYHVDLPHEFAVLGPLFSLEIGEDRWDEVADAGDVEHRIEDGRVRLSFDRSLWNIGRDLPEEVRVRARNQVQPLTLVFRRGPEGGYALDRIERR